MTFPDIREEKLQEHGMDDFMYLPLDFQPEAPEVPGFPGLWLNIGGDNSEMDADPQRVFTRITTTPRALWQYQGQYEIKLAKQLTQEEWGNQTVSVRNTWAKQLAKKCWGGYCRASIYARKHWGRLPTNEECQDIIDRNLHAEIGQVEIAGALTRGEVNMDVYTMKCVGYDSAFQRNIAQKFPTWVPKPSKAKGQKSNKRKAEQKPKTNGKPNKRPKHEEDDVDFTMVHSDSDDDSEEHEEYEEEEEEGPDDEVLNPWRYISKGTRSRPAMRT